MILAGKKVLGFSQLKCFQVKNLLAGNDRYISQQTGIGKSFQEQLKAIIVNVSHYIAKW